MQSCSHLKTLNECWHRFGEKKGLHLVYIRLQCPKQVGKRLFFSPVSFLNLPLQVENEPACMRRRSFKCYICLTEIDEKNAISQGVIYSLTAIDAAQTRVGFTRRACRRLEFPSHIRYSPVRGRVCQEFKALAAWFFFSRTGGERLGAQIGRRGWMRLGRATARVWAAGRLALQHASAWFKKKKDWPRISGSLFSWFLFFCPVEVRGANGDVQECRSSPEAENHRV